MPNADELTPENIRKEFSDLLKQRNENSLMIYSVHINSGPILTPGVFERLFQTREAILQRLKHLQEEYPSLTDDNPDTYAPRVEGVMFMFRHHRAISAAVKAAEIGSKFGGIVGKFVRSIFPRKNCTHKKED